MKKASVTLNKNGISFQLQGVHNFDWLDKLGNVFCVFDKQDSGNISFGVEKDEKKIFVKYAGALPVNFSGKPREAIAQLKNSVQIYKDLKHPHLININNYFSVENGYAVVFDWFDGENLHPHWAFPPPLKYTHLDSPFFRFKKLPIKSRLRSLDSIYSFHEHIESKGYVAVDFYDGSILYDFVNNVTKICDIDFYRKKPTLNDMGEQFWGSSRFKSPEEFKYGAPIDEKTNVYTMGAVAFCLLGSELERTFLKWEASEELYKVALRAVDNERINRYSSISEFYAVWKKALAEIRG